MKTLSFRNGLLAGAFIAGLVTQSQAMAVTQSPATAPAQAPVAPRSDAMTALCRVKAKESANLAFRSCMSESKTGEVESLRREYQEKLAAIKAEYEKELGRVSGKTGSRETSPAVEESKSIEQESGDAESDLMKNAILDERTDGIQSRDRASHQAVKSGTASRSQLEKREPKGPDPQGPRTKRVNGPSQLAASRPAGAKAILFNDGMDLPEPIPVEASFGATHQ